MKVGKLSKAGQAGIDSLIGAAKIRRDHIYDLLMQDDQQCTIISGIYYHRNCYMSYTSKRNLQFATKETDSKTDQDPSQNQDSEPRKRLTLKTSCWQTCLICSQKKYKGDSHLHLIQSYERAEKLQSAALLLMDERLLINIRGEDLIAKEGLYHNGCMASYLKRASVVSPTPSHITSSVAVDAFQQLINEIEPVVFKEQKALSLISMRNRYDEILTQNNMDVTKSHSWFKQKVVTYFGEKVILQKIQGKGNPYMIISSDISMANAIQAATNLKKEIAYLKDD